MMLAFLFMCAVEAGMITMMVMGRRAIRKLRGDD